MSNPTVRSIAQLVLLVACLGGGYAIAGWAGLGIGVAVFVVAIVLMTIPRMKNLSPKKADDAVNAPPVATTSAAPGPRAPQDYRRKQARPRPKPRMEYPTGD